MPDSFFHHGKILQEKFTQAGVTAQDVASELKITPEEFLLLFSHGEIKSSTLVRVMGAIEIVRMRQNGEL